MSEVDKIRKNAKNAFDFMEDNYEIWSNYRTKGLSRITQEEIEWADIKWVKLDDVLSLAERLDKLVKDQKETDRLLKLEAKMIADDMDRMEKTIEMQGEKLDKVPLILVDVKCEKVMKNPKWNSLEQIADIQELYVRKNGKICVDIVDVQGIIGEALDDYMDLVKKELERELE